MPTLLTAAAAVGGVVAAAIVAVEAAAFETAVAVQASDRLLGSSEHWGRNPPGARQLPWSGLYSISPLPSPEENVRCQNVKICNIALFPSRHTLQPVA